jgi:hypothetical protein
MVLDSVDNGPDGATERVATATLHDLFITGAILLCGEGVLHEYGGIQLSIRSLG